LRQRQPTPYRCLARLRGRWVLSLSPELFFELGGAPGAAMLPGRIAVRPMKGTAPRGADAAADALAAARLRADPKNRAENLMILDLLRNDLGRLARPGSVQVPQRFAIEPHPAVWQMTSSAQAELAPGTTWPALWRALFPCGSVVGAPKHRAMQIIGELETGARGLYTGAIGWIAPQGGAAPEQTQARFSVAIRTLEIDARPRRGLRAARLGLGSGIIADSNADAEWAECLLKGRFATALDPGFGLIETFAARWPGQRAAVDAHLRRLARSARWFGFRFDRRGLVAALARAQAAWDPAQALRSRIELRHDGSFEVTAAPLAPLRPGRVELLLARDVLDDAVLDAADALLRHKTTRRACFDAAWRAAEARGAFDALFFNQRGELCEGGRSSVFVKLDGRWFTPPLRCGLLPGVTRAALLAEASLGATERVLNAADLQRAEDLLVCNALRGALPARLRGAAS
jgi:para-aminobenzoate synthetase/4-amino-4-deoxychorismate lyase